MKKNKFITFIILTLLITVTIFGMFTTPITAYFSQTLEDFEYATGVKSGSNAYGSFTCGGTDTEISALHHYSGATSCLVEMANQHYIWYNISTPTIFSGISFNWFLDTTTNHAGRSYTIKIYNETQEVVSFFIDLNLMKLYIRDYSIPAYVEILDVGTYDFFNQQWTEIGFTDERSEGSPINYITGYCKNISDGTIHGSAEVAYNGAKEWDENQNMKFKNLTYISDAGIVGVVHSFVDDISIIYGSGSGSGGGNDYSNYLKECNLEGRVVGSQSPYVSSPNFQGNIIETRHYVKYLKPIKAIDYYFTKAQYDYVPELNDYLLHLRGMATGVGINPTEWIVEDSNTYVLRFDDIDYDMVDIYGEEYKEFISELIILDTTAPTMMWLSPEDIIWKHSKMHGDSFYWGNNQFNGDDIQGGISLSHCMCIIFDEVQVTYDCEFSNDVLIVAPTTGYTGHTINVNYQLTTRFTDTYINITKDGESLTNQPFSLPALLDECSSNEYSFTAWSTGTYNVSLWRDGTEGSLDYQEVTILENPDKDTYVTSYPNPSKVYNDYTVLVNYTHPSGYEGALFISNEPSIEGLTPYTTFPSGTINATFIRNNIYAGTTYYILAFLNPSGAYGIMNTILPQNAIHPHIIEGLSQSDAWIDVDDYVYIEKGGKGVQHFSCNHGYIGQNVVIYDNDYKVADVPNGAYTNVPYDVTEVGNHQVEMVLIGCCGEPDITLYTTNYTAVYLGGGGGQTTEPVLPELDAKVGALIGIILTIVLTLLPILIQIGFKVDIDVPPLVYGAFGCFGIILSVYLGSFDIWVIVFIIAVLLLFSVIQFFQNR